MSELACHGCDLLLTPRPLAAGERAGCPRCGESLHRERRDSLDRSFALTLAALLVFIPANVFPIMSLSVEGRLSSSTIFGGVRELYNEGLVALAILIFVATIAAPLAKLCTQAAVLFRVRAGRAGRRVARLFRWSALLGPWAMLEVYLLGALVAIVKLADLARVELGHGFYAFLALMLLSTAATALLDPRQVWDRIEVRG